MANESVYSTALMEHNAHPDHKHELGSFTHEHEGVNPSCGDHLVLQLRLAPDGRTIEDAGFTGHGCAVSQASADIMADLVIGQTVDEARRLSDLFMRMIRGEELTDDEQDDLDEAFELESISRMPARVKCAELGWRTLDQVLAK